MREEGVRRSLDEAKKRVISSGGDDVKVRALESLAKSKRAEFERLQTQLEAARTTSDARTVPVEVQIVSRARSSSEKAWPKVGMITLLAMVATLLLGLAFVVTRELFGMARQAPATTALAVSASEPASRAVPAVTTTRTMPSLARHIIAKARGRTGFRTLVIGQPADTNAGTAAIELARQLAHAKQQVILLDWSLDGAGLAPELGVSPTLGITDCALGPRLLRGRDRAPVALGGARHRCRLERRRHGSRQGQGSRQHAARRARRCLRSRGHRRRARGGA